MLNVREWAGKNYATVSFSPLRHGTLVDVCDSIKADDKSQWLYIKYGGKYGFVKASYVEKIPAKAIEYIRLLDTYHHYVKAHISGFINEYMSDVDTFQKAKARVKSGKLVGMTCAVPTRWAFAQMGIRRSDGSSLVYGSGGTFVKCYTGDVKKYLTRIAKGKHIGMTIKQAEGAGLLKYGDILAFTGYTHTSVCSGEDCMMYEGGGGCLHHGVYEDGILIDRSKYARKISEILRWR